MPDPFDVSADDLLGNGGSQPVSFDMTADDLLAGGHTQQFKPVLAGAGQAFQDASNQVGRALLAGPALIEAGVRRFVGPAPSADDFSPLGDYLKMQQKQAAGEAAAASYDQRPGAAGVGQQILDSTAGSIPLMVTTMGVGGAAAPVGIATTEAITAARVAAGAKAAGLGTFAQTAQEDPTPTGIANAAVQGVLEGVFTKLGGATGVEKIFKERGPQGLTVGVSQALKELGIDASKEMGEEGATGFTQDIAQQLIVDHKLNVDQSVNAGIVSAGAGGLMGGMANVPNALADVYRSGGESAAPLPTRPDLVGQDNGGAVGDPTAVQPVPVAQPAAPVAPQPMPQGPSGEGFAGYADAQPIDQSQALAEAFSSMPDESKQKTLETLGGLFQVSTAPDEAPSSNAPSDVPQLFPTEDAIGTKTEQGGMDNAVAAPVEGAKKRPRRGPKSVSEVAPEAQPVPAQAAVSDPTKEISDAVVHVPPRPSGERSALANARTDRTAGVDAHSPSIERKPAESPASAAPRSPAARLTADRFHRVIADLPISRKTPGHADAIMALVAARARAVGKTADQWIGDRISGVKTTLAEPSLNQDVLDQSAVHPAGKSLAFPDLLRQWRKANGDRTPAKGGEEWQQLEQEARAIDSRRGVRVMNQESQRSAHGRIVYHGSDQSVDSFADNSFFAFDRNIAKLYGEKIHEISVNSDRVLKADSANDVIAALHAIPDVPSKILKAVDGFKGGQTQELLWNASRSTAPRDLQKAIDELSLEYDAIHFTDDTNTRGDLNRDHETLFVLNSNVLKTASRDNAAEIDAERGVSVLHQEDMSNFQDHQSKWETFFRAGEDLRAEGFGAPPDSDPSKYIRKWKSPTPEALERHGVDSSDPIETKYLEAGLDGEQMPQATSAVGWRFGDAPSGGFSHNRMDNRSEAGVSMMEARDGNGVEHKAAATMASGRSIKYFKGTLVPFKGGDKEPLFFAPVPASKAEWEASKATDSHGEKSNRLHQGDTLNDARVVRRGAVEFAADTRAIIHAFEAADQSTALHELGHVFRRDLSDIEQAVAGKWAGAKLVDGSWKWGRAAEEKFARGFERYMRDGIAPTPALKEVFQKFAGWLREVYRTVTGSAIDIKLTPEIRGVFDRMFQEGQQSAPAPKESPRVEPILEAKPVATAEAGEPGTRTAVATVPPADRPTSPRVAEEAKPVESEPVAKPPKATTEQQATADKGRPDLANPGTADSVREVVNAARAKMEPPEVRHREETERDADALLSRAGGEDALRKKVRAGDFTPRQSSPELTAPANNSAGRTTGVPDAKSGVEPAQPAPVSQTVTVRWPDGTADVRAISGYLTSQVIQNLIRGNRTGTAQPVKVELTLDQVQRLGGYNTGKNGLARIPTSDGGDIAVTIAAASNSTAERQDAAHGQQSADISKGSVPQVNTAPGATGQPASAAPAQPSGPSRDQKPDGRSAKPTEAVRQSGSTGDVTSIEIPGSQPIPATYEVRELSDIRASHTYEDGSPSATAGYPSGLQPRDYKHGNDEDLKVKRQAGSFKATYLISDHPDATSGPSVITEDGTVINGNSRVMTLQVLTPSQMGSYRELLIKKAGGFGIEADHVKAMRQPVLVRVVKMAPDSQEAQRFARQGNVSATQSQSPVRTAASLGGLINQDAIDALEIGEDTTFSEAVTGPKGREFRRQVMESLPPTVRSTYFDESTGDLTDPGKTLMRDLLLSKVLPPEIIERLGEDRAAILRTIEATVPQLLRMQGMKAGEPVVVAMRQALAWLASHPTVRKASDVDSLLDADGKQIQQDLFNSQSEALTPEGRMLLSYLLREGSASRRFKAGIVSAIGGLDNKVNSFLADSLGEPAQIVAEALGVPAADGATFAERKPETKTVVANEVASEAPQSQAPKRKATGTHSAPPAPINDLGEKIGGARTLKTEETTEGTTRLFAPERALVEEDEAATPTPKLKPGQQAAALSQKKKGRIPVAAIAPEAESGTEPVKRLKSIIRSLRESLIKAGAGDPGLYEGEAPKGTGGIFDEATGMAALARHGDLDAAAHEVGHRIAWRFNLDQLEGKVGMAHELADFSQYGSEPPTDLIGKDARDAYRNKEGWAELIRAFIVNPEETAARAPAMTDALREEVPTAVLKALTEYGDAARQFLGMPAEDRTEANIQSISDLIKQDKLHVAVANWFALPEALLAAGQEPKALGKLRAFMRTAWNGMGNDPQDVRAGASQATPARLKELRRSMDGWQKFRHLWQNVWSPAYARYAEGLSRRGVDVAKLPPEHNFQILNRLLAGNDGRALEQMFGSGLVDGRMRPVVDTATGERMTWNWLMDPVSQGQDTAKLIDRALAMGVEQRTAAEGAKRRDRASKEVKAWIEGLDEFVRDGGSIDELNTLIDQYITTTGADAAEAAGLRVEAMRLSKAGKKSDLRELSKWSEKFGRARRREAAESASRLSGIGAGMVSDELQAREALRNRDQGNDTDRPAMDEFLRRYRRWANHLLQVLTEKGIFTAEAAVKMQDSGVWTNPDTGESHDIYVAMHRIFDGENTSARVGGKFTGSTRMIANPLRNLVEATLNAIERGERNQAMNALVDAFRSNEGERVDLHDLGRQVPEEQVHEARKDGGSGLVNGRKPYRIMNNGVLESWTFDPQIEASIEAAKASGDSNILIRLWGQLTRLMRAGIVTVPSFMVRNIIRDTQSRVIASETGIGSGMADVFKGFGKLKTKDGERTPNELNRLAGGSYAGYIEGKDVLGSELALHLDQLRKRGFFGKAVKIVSPKTALRLLEKAGELAEQINRRAEFASAFTEAKGRGLDDYNASLYAADKSRGLIDFAEAGLWGRQLTKSILFLNPAIQGLSRVARTMKVVADHAAEGKTMSEKAKRVLTARATVALGLMTAASVALRLLVKAALGKDEEDKWRQQPASTRDFHWIIPMPAGMPDLAIPKEYAWGFIMSGAERLADAVMAKMEGNDAEAKRAFEGYRASAIGALLPINDVSSVMGGFGPLVEAWSNYDAFRQRNIIPPWEKGLDPKLRDTSRASYLGKQFQALTDIDARLFDHVVQGYAGGWGRMATSTGRDAGWWAGTATGLGKSEPLGGARDVEWVRDEAASRGLTSSQQFKGLSQILKRTYEAGAADERERLGRLARQRATEIRAQWEKLPPIKERK